MLGLEDFNLEFLQAIPNADQYEFHGVLSYDDVTAKTFDIDALIDEARATLRDFDGPIDAIINYWDFPSVAIAPILTREHGLPGPTLESVLRCEHKYWSRLEQEAVLPGQVPPFALFNPFEKDSLARLELDFPFWIKPVTAHSSLLGFRVDRSDQLEPIRRKLCRGIGRFGDALESIMSYADVPEEIRHAGRGVCIAEGLISAPWQCTVEGYVCQGQVEMTGIVDSVRGESGSSFERYEYPSQLDDDIKLELKEMTFAVIRRVGLDQAPFNVEYFYDPDTGRISLLEINARISQSHSPLFRKVDGAPHKHYLVDLALGNEPDFHPGEGEFATAAKFMPRIYHHNGEAAKLVVVDAPDPEEIEEVKRVHPTADIQVHVTRGMRLAESPHHDSYSSELAALFIGARSHDELMREYDRVLDDLHIRVELERESVSLPT